MSDAPWWVKLAVEYGILGLVVLALSYVIYKSAGAIYQKFLGDEGLLTLIAKRHIAFLDNLERAQGEMLAAMKDMSASLHELQKAQISLAEGLLRLALGEKEEAKKHIEEAHGIFEQAKKRQENGE